MKGLGLKLLKIHLLFLSFLPLFIDKTFTRNDPVSFLYIDCPDNSSCKSECLENRLKSCESDFQNHFREPYIFNI